MFDGEKRKRRLEGRRKEGRKRKRGEGKEVGAQVVEERERERAG